MSQELGHSLLQLCLLGFAAAVAAICRQDG